MGPADELRACLVLHNTRLNPPGARDGTDLLNTYSADSQLAKSAGQIMHLYKCGINFIKIFPNKYVAIFITMHIASHIGGQQQNMRQFQSDFKSSPTPHLGAALL